MFGVEILERWTTTRVSGRWAFAEEPVHGYRDRRASLVTSLRKPRFLQGM